MFKWLKRKKVVLSKATYDKDTKILTKYWSDGNKYEYKGSCTVWHKLPYMKRAGTMTESGLCDIWEYINHYGNPYPHAHKKDYLDNTHDEFDEWWSIYGNKDDITYSISRQAWYEAKKKYK